MKDKVIKKFIPEYIFTMYLVCQIPRSSWKQISWVLLANVFQGRQNVSEKQWVRCCQVSSGRNPYLWASVGHLASWLCNIYVTDWTRTYRLTLWWCSSGLANLLFWVLHSQRKKLNPMYMYNNNGDIIVSVSFLSISNWTGWINSYSSGNLR